MKSLYQHISEKLIINKNYKNDNFIYNSFNDFCEAIKKFSDNIEVTKDACYVSGNTDYSICIIPKNYKTSTKRYGGVICPQITLFWNNNVNGFYFWIEDKYVNEITIVDKDDNEYKINFSELDILEKTSIKHRTKVLDTYVFLMNDHNIEVLVDKIIYIANNQ